MATMTLETPNEEPTKAEVRAIFRDLKAKSARIAEQARATTDVIRIRQMIDLYYKRPQ